MGRYLWMKVTSDEYELPVAVADTAKELAKIVGTTENTINSRISHAKADGCRCQYKRVEVEESEVVGNG